MEDNIVSFVLASENRKKIVKALFEYPRRQWSCSYLEEITKVPHSTAFRTLEGLKKFGILKSLKINKKDILYELSENPLIPELNNILDLEKITTRRIAKTFVGRIKSSKIYSVILYGSSVKGNIKFDSDIDILVLLNRHNKKLEQRIFDSAAEYSSEINKTISIIIMDKMEIEKEKNNQFLKSLRDFMEVIYGKEPF
mgnify:CR=1 FL=1